MCVVIPPMENLNAFQFCTSSSKFVLSRLIKMVFVVTFLSQTYSLRFIKLVNQSIWVEIVCVNGIVILHVPYAHIFSLWFSFRFNKSNWNCTSSFVQSRESVMQLLNCHGNVIIKTECIRKNCKQKTGKQSARRCHRSAQHQSVHIIWDTIVRISDWLWNKLNCFFICK